MIMVDYLQLMRVAGTSEGRTAEISEISRNLKAIAKEFRCPVVALSQLNRAGATSQQAPGELRSA